MLRYGKKVALPTYAQVERNRSRADIFDSSCLDFGHRASNTTLQPAASGQHVMTASIFKYLGPQSEIAYICRRNGVSVQAGVHT